MKEEFSIKVTIGNRVYPLTIERHEEELIRKAAKLVNENMRELENNYAVRDKQDLLAMTALFFANQALENSDANSVWMGELSDQLNEINARVSGYLE